MKAAKDALLAAGFVILHEIHIDATFSKVALAVGFHKVTTMVAKDRRLDDGHALDGRLDEIEFAHKKSPIF